ncbi:MAG: indole acetimide hydrolase [Gammaproteobacteria bacterium]|nr:indole acetimide hydrolase [Gammaproteobacteria bacterium]
MSELWELGAVALARRIKDGESSARAAVDSIIARIEAVNDSVRAIPCIFADQARTEADAADAALARGAAVGPLHGVPFTVKENIDIAGWPTTQGVPALARNLPPADAPVVAQLRAAGAIPVASTNLPDFALRWHSESTLHGATRNPWDASRVAGGSSGGAAAALATGMAPLALGNDVGGSLRYPAQACGVCSVKPSLGRIARANANMPAELPLSFQLMYVEGPMAREIADLRVALAAMSGPDPRDPWWVAAPLRGSAPAAPIRVAMTIDPAGMGVDPQVAAGVRVAADALANAGYAVEEIEPPHIVEAMESWRRVLFTEVHAQLMPMLRQVVSADAIRSLELCNEFIPTLDRDGYLHAMADRTRLLRDWRLFQERYPIVLGPVSTAPPFAVGADIESSARAREIMDSQRLIVAVNLLCLPVVIVPVGVAEGLPQAVQIIGMPMREDLCLDAAEALERACGRITPIDPR